MDRLPLIISTLCFLLGFAYTAYTLKAGRFRASRFNLGMMAVGFLCQTWFLHVRGAELGRCPLTNLFEVLIFLSWSIVLLYLIIGPTYRLSLLGAFTYPLVFFIQLIALLSPIDPPARVLLQRPDPWLELHAALSVISYGAFAMAGVAGVMYLAQERQLKTHHFGRIFYQMPPITHLAIANVRLLWAGLGLLTVGLAAGFFVQAPMNGLKITWGAIMWGLYFLLLLFRRIGPRFGPHRVALSSVIAFILALLALWGLNHLPGQAQ